MAKGFTPVENFCGKYVCKFLTVGRKSRMQSVYLVQTFYDIVIAKSRFLYAYRYGQSCLSQAKHIEYNLKNIRSQAGHTLARHARDAEFGSRLRPYIVRTCVLYSNIPY